MTLITESMTSSIEGGGWSFSMFIGSWFLTKRFCREGTLIESMTSSTKGDWLRNWMDDVRDRSLLIQRVKLNQRKGSVPREMELTLSACHMVAALVLHDRDMTVRTQLGFG
jgi:hypothetical protein